MINKLANSQQNWGYFKKFIIGKKTLLIYPTSQIFFIIPKRFFKNEDDWNAVIELVKNKISKGK